MNRRLSIATPLLALSVLVASCSPHLSDAIPPLEEILGHGWTCYTVPDVFKMAGNVIERTSSGTYVHYLDFSDRSESGESQIGAVSQERVWTFSAIVKLLQLSEPLQDGFSVDASADRRTSLEVAYGDTRKHRIDGDDVHYIRTELERNPARLTQGSQYFVFRESHSATSAEILVDSSAAARLTGMGIPTNALPESSRLANEGEERYRLNAEFGGRLGICTVATPLHIERSFDGGIAIRLGADRPLPESITIVEKRP